MSVVDERLNETAMMVKSEDQASVGPEATSVQKRTCAGQALTIIAYLAFTVATWLIMNKS